MGPWVVDKSRSVEGLVLSVELTIFAIGSIAPVGWSVWPILVGFNGICSVGPGSMARSIRLG